MKRRLGVIVGIVAIIAIAVWILVLTNKERTVEDISDETSLFTYTTEQKNNNVIFTISGEFSRNSWKVENSNEAVTSVRLKENRKGNASFLIKAGESGFSDLTFILDDEKNAHVGYSIAVSVFVDNDGVAQIVSSTPVQDSNQEFYGTVDSAYYACVVKTDSISVYLLSNSDAEWHTDSNLQNILAISTSEQISDEGGDQAKTAADIANRIKAELGAEELTVDTTSVFTMNAQGFGVGYVRFINDSLSEALEISLMVSEQRTITVFSAEAMAYTSPEAEQSARVEEYVKLIEDGALYPGKLMPTDFSSKTELAESGKEYTRFKMTVKIGQMDWQYMLYFDLSEEELMENRLSLTDISKATIEGKNVGIYMGGDTMFAVWQEKSCVCALRNIDTDQFGKDVVTAAAKEVIRSLGSGNE